MRLRGEATPGRARNHTGPTALSRSMRRISALLAVPALLLLLAGCGDDGDDSTTVVDGPPPTEETEPTETTEAVPTDGPLDAELLVIGSGLPALDGPPAVRVIDPDDRETARRVFSSGHWNLVDEALADADLTGRTLLGGVVHEGCFPAGGVSVELVDGTVVFTAEDVDEQEGEVDCAQAVITSALVSVATDDLPQDGDDPSPTTTTDPDIEIDGPEVGADNILGDVVVIEPTDYEPAGTVGPGLARDRVDVEALYGRYDLGEPDAALLARVESGEDVLVAGVLGEECTPPTGAYVTVFGDELELSAAHDADQIEDDRVCDALAQAVVVVAVGSDEVEGVATVNGDPADGPTGVGAVLAVEAVDIGAEPLAAPFDEVDPATLPGAPDLDLPAVEGDAVRLVFVVEACQPDTAELIADLGAGTVRVEAQQSGASVDCDAFSPYLVVADLAAAHADLEPVTE